MADIKKLIYKLKTVGELTDNITIEISDLELLDDAADALEQLLAENEKLRAENIMHHNAADNYYAELTEYRQERNEALAELEQVKAERDAAISDLETIMAYGGDNTDTCQYCKNVQCYARGGTKLCLPSGAARRRTDMERLTGRRDERAYIVGCPDFALPKIVGLIIQQTVDRLAAYEDTGLEPEQVVWLKEIIDAAFAEDTSKIERLRELAQADRLIGSNVYEPNKRGFISVYEIISVHISKCSILVGWNLIDGVYSNLNGFEISALGKTVFLTREEAEQALRREQE